MADYNTVLDYYKCGTDIKDRIERIDQIIEALELASLTGAVNEGTNEYSLDDGQTKIRKVFRSLESIYKAIDSFERLRNTLINRNCLGNVGRIRDKDSYYINKVR